MSLATAIIGTNGDIIRFDGADGYHMALSFGAMSGVAPVSLPQQDSPGLVAGSLAGTPRRLSRPVQWRVIVEGVTEQVMFERLERLATALDPVTPGASAGRDAFLRVTRPDGETRQLTARYSSGMGNWPMQVSHQTAVALELLFRADDPHWHAIIPDNEFVSFPVTGSGSADTPFDASGTSFDNPGTPFDGFQATAEQGSAVATMTNTGNAEAWPLWIITGAATSIELTNRATGSVWRWTGTLAAGETLVVDAADRSPSVRVDGVNAWSGLAASANNLWPLIAGQNQIVAEVLGADTSTTLQGIWQRRYLNP